MSKNRANKSTSSSLKNGDIVMFSGDDVELLIQVIRDCRDWRSNMEFCVTVRHKDPDWSVGSRFQTKPIVTFFMPLGKLMRKDNRYALCGSQELCDFSLNLTRRADFLVRLAHAPGPDTQNRYLLWNGYSDPEWTEGLSHEQVKDYPFASMALTDGMLARIRHARAIDN